MVNGPPTSGCWVSGGSSEISTTRKRLAISSASQWARTFFGHAKRKKYPPPPHPRLWARTSLRETPAMVVSRRLRDSRHGHPEPLRRYEEVAYGGTPERDDSPYHMYARWLCLHPLRLQMPSPYHGHHQYVHLGGCTSNIRIT